MKKSILLILMVALISSCSMIGTEDQEPTPTFTSPTSTLAPYPTNPTEPSSNNSEILKSFIEASCTGEIPEGFLTNDNGVPYSIHAPYEPKDLPNPITIANFNNAVRSSISLSEDEKLCWVNKSAALLVSTSETVESSFGNTARFYLYPFEFKPNPSTEAMDEGWVSGLAQGGVLSALWGTWKITGEDLWKPYIQEAYETFFIPIEEGGFVSEQTGYLWFEEYPSNPPTTVLNGMNYATVAFVNWTKETNDVRGFEMFPKIIESYEKLLPMFSIEDEGGTLATYDLVRGMGTENEIRLVPVDGPVNIREAYTHGTKMNVEPSSKKAVKSDDSWIIVGEDNQNLVIDGSFEQDWTHWRKIGSNVEISNEIVAINTDGANEWRGFTQEVPSAMFEELNGDSFSLQYKMRRVEPEGGGRVSAKVDVFERCDGELKKLYGVVYPRGDSWGTYIAEVPKPNHGCSILLQFLASDKQGDGTILLFDDVSFQQSSKIDSRDNSFVPEYDHFVWRNPVSEIMFKGSGRFIAQVYEGGRWITIGEVNLDEGDSKVLIPERFTGRNINYKYHNGHPYELMAVYKVLEAPVLLKYALKWDAMALGYKVPEIR